MPEQPQEPQQYDLIVIGSGPAGQKAALAAAHQRFRVAIIEQRQTIGGVCLHTGTIPSKTLREAVLYLLATVCTVSTAPPIVRRVTLRARI